MPHRACPQAWAGGMGTTGHGEGEAGHGGAVSVLEWRPGGFRPVLYAHFLNIYFFKFHSLAPLFYI